MREHPGTVAPPRTSWATLVHFTRKASPTAELAPGIFVGNLVQAEAHRAEFLRRSLMLTVVLSEEVEVDHWPVEVILDSNYSVKFAAFLNQVLKQPEAYISRAIKIGFFVKEGGKLGVWREF